MRQWWNGACGKRRMTKFQLPIGSSLARIRQNAVNALNRRVLQRCRILDPGLQQKMPTCFIDVPRENQFARLNK